MKIIDTHCDTLTEIFNKKQSLHKNDLHIDIEKLKKYDSCAQFFACFTEHSENVKKYALDAFDNFLNQIKLNCNETELAKNYDDYISIIKNKKIAVFFSIENGGVIEKTSDVELFYELGIRLISLTWNNDNRLASGVNGNKSRGLTEYGKDVLKEMNRLGIITDVSHLNEKSFWDIAEFSDKTFVASHSNAYSVCPNKRNLKEEQISEIIKRNGFIGINLYPYFLTNTEKARIADILNMIEYFLSIGGENVIGLGCDFDGVSVLPEGIRDIRDAENIFNEMAQIGYSQELIDKIAHKNCENMIKLF